MLSFTHPLPASDSTSLQKAIQQVQQSGEFRRFQSPDSIEHNPFEQWLDQLMKNPAVKALLDQLKKNWQQVWNAIKKMFSHMPHVNWHLPKLGSTSPVLSYVLLALVLVLGLSVLGFCGWKLWHFWIKRQRPQPMGVLSRPNTLQPAHTYWQAAQVMAAQQDYAGAFYQLYWALLASLHESKQVVFRPYLTHAEYRQFLISGNPIVYRAFNQVARQFDRLWYGQQAITASQYQTCLEAYQTAAQYFKQEVSS